MKRALAVALVVIVLVTGLPLVMSMDGMLSCDSCNLGVVGGMVCIGFLAAVVTVVVILVSRLLRDRRLRSPSRLLAHLIERPPQPATA